MNFAVFAVASVVWIGLLIAIKVVIGRRFKRDLKIDDIEKYLVFGVLGIAIIAALTSL